ncbi:MAG: AEC family transporter [Clostridia bacterium]|nr:AEC family transporter [Clostridia bacterium]
MLNNLILSLNTVLPIVILTAVGMLLGKLKLFSDAFYSGADKFVFKVALPCMIFLQVAEADFSESAGYLKLMLAIVGILIALTVIYCLVMPIFIKDKRKLGATVQGMFRSNVAILGAVLVENMFPAGPVQSAAKVAYAVVMPFVVLMYNVFSVGILAIFMPTEGEEKNSRFGLKDFGRAALETLKNPLIIAVVLGFPFTFFRIAIPGIVRTSMGYLSGCTTGLALISLGAGFSFKSLAGNIGLASFVTAVKTAVQPLIGLSVLYLLGFRGPELAVGLVVFGTPTAVSSYIMAKNMKSDYELAGQILLLTTIVCIFTLFLGSLILRTIGLI